MLSWQLVRGAGQGAPTWERKKELPWPCNLRLSQCSGVLVTLQSKQQLESPVSRSVASVAAAFIPSSILPGCWTLSLSPALGGALLCQVMGEES